MLETIILLTGPVEQTALSALLRQKNPRLTVRTAETLSELEAIEPKMLGTARLIGFATPVIVPGKMLRRLRFGAYNFHPGPPHYPGWAPSHFALYEGAREFGTTAHVMFERVDSGPIVGADLFTIPPGIDIDTLNRLTFKSLAQLLWSLADALANRAEPLAELPLRWKGPHRTRRQYAALCDIRPDIAKAELDRRVAALGECPDSMPTITLHGHYFRYVAPEKAAAAKPQAARAAG